jgi:hypothetical protein
VDAGGVQGDLVVVALPGVQRFITEARSTSDVSAASRIYSALARQVVDVLGTGGLLILPARQDPPPGTPRTPDPPASGRDGEDDGQGQDAEDDQTGLPNRIAALLPEGSVLAAVRALDQARQAVERALGTSGRETTVPGLEPLVPDGGPGAWFGRSGGPWVYPERWRPETLAREAGAGPARGGRETVTQIEPAVRDGHRAARLLRDLMAQPARQAPPLASYLAVVVQDLDSMGLFLSGRSVAASGKEIPIIPNEHGRVSRDLLRLARWQTEALRTGKLLSVPVYAGGDDLLTFSPAATALGAARACHDLIPPTLPHASAAAASKSNASAAACPKALTASAAVRQSPPARPGSPPACAPSNAPPASPASTTPPSRCPSPSDHFPLRARRPAGKSCWNRWQNYPIRRSASQLGRWSQPRPARPHRGVLPGIPPGQRELPGHGAHPVGKSFGIGTAGASRWGSADG